MRVIVVLLTLAPLAATAAPVPRSVLEREAVFRRFGQPSDSPKECEFLARGPNLVIRLPKKTPRTTAGIIDYPHTRRPVSGDFAVQVKVSYPLPAEVPPVGGGTWVGGGLFIWAGERNHVTFHRHHQPCGLFDCRLAWDQCLNTEYIHPDPTKSMGGQDVGGNPRSTPIYLRLVRKNLIVTAEYSFDGEKWTQKRSRETALLEQVEVGVYALQTTGEPAEVTFEEFTLSPPDGPGGKTKP